MDLALENKVVVVTGSSKNIGLEMARAFAREGAITVMNARGRERLESVAQEIRDCFGTRVEAVVADIGRKSGVEHLIERVEAMFDQVDVLINNAYTVGETIGTPILEVDDAVWEQNFYTNLLAPFRLARGFARRMMAGRGGSIINMVSGSAFLPNPHLAPYGATKAGLWMLTRYLAAECAPKVRVNALCPGLIMSDTGGPGINPTTEGLLHQIPMGRPGAPSEIAPAALYLASDSASYTTGALLMVNGGRPW